MTHTWRGHTNGKDIQAATNPSVKLVQISRGYKVETAHLQFLLLWYVCHLVLKQNLLNFIIYLAGKSPRAVALTTRFELNCSAGSGKLMANWGEKGPPARRYGGRHERLTKIHTEGYTEEHTDATRKNKQRDTKGYTEKHTDATRKNRQRDTEGFTGEHTEGYMESL